MLEPFFKLSFHLSQSFFLFFFFEVFSFFLSPKQLFFFSYMLGGMNNEGVIWMSKFCLLLFYMRRRGLVRFHLLQIRSRSCVFFDITFSFLSCLSCFSRHHVLLSFSLLCIVLSWRHYNGGRLTHAKPRNAAQRRIRAHRTQPPPPPPPVYHHHFPSSKKTKTPSDA
jgi:hypothetical protein